MEHIACISYGKDSLAMLEIIHKHKLPLDRIVHVSLMATPSIPADYPEVVEWKTKANEIIENRYGIKVETLTSEYSYQDLFYKIPKRSAKNISKQGQIRGFPSLRSNWCTQDLKVKEMRKLKGSIQYIGIAVDEPKRHSQLSEKLISPLVKFNVTEAECYKICEGLGLLAPTYLQSKRSGCWFCHAQPIAQLRILRHQYPEYWKLLLKWDADSPIPFRHGKRHGTHTVKDFDERFYLEDIGILDMNDKSFRWTTMEDYKKIYIEEGGITPSPVPAPSFTPSLRIISHERKEHQRSDV